MMLGYIAAAQWGRGTCQHPPGALGGVSGVIGTLRDECCWSLLEALGTPQAQGAPVTG